MESNTNTARPKKTVLMAIIATLFGLLTLKSGGAVLLFDGPARIAAGHYIPFVLWFNFLAGFFYILAGIGLFLWREWAVKLSLFIALATLLVFTAFGLSVFLGSEYEMRTVGAMVMRSVVWLSIALLSHKAWKLG